MSNNTIISQETQIQTTLKLFLKGNASLAPGHIRCKTSRVYGTLQADGRKAPHNCMVTVIQDWEIHIERSAEKDNLGDQANWNSILQDEGSNIIDS